jgi:hypothetical protein
MTSLQGTKLCAGTHENAADGGASGGVLLQVKIV